LEADALGFFEVDGFLLGAEAARFGAAARGFDAPPVSIVVQRRKGPSRVTPPCVPSGVGRWRAPTEVIRGTPIAASRATSRSRRAPRSSTAMASR
jgi:hypothetical protein